MATKRRSRIWLMAGTAALLAMALAFAFWPRPSLVDLGRVEYAPMQVTIDEEARTRVHDAYVVSAPVDGRLLRVAVEPGDVVEQGKSLLAKMLPANSPALDYRSREEGKAAVGSAEAALWGAQAQMDQAQADKSLAVAELRRTRTLRNDGLISQAALDEAERNFNALDAALRAARSTIAQREAELATARARLISFAGPGSSSESASGHVDQSISLVAPISGQVLQVMQKSATVVAAGTPIIGLGDIANDLEIVAELLSTDAVKVAPGARVIVEKWGGTNSLSGVVERLEPWGYTKFSALGVEEQRVNAIIQFTDPAERRDALGDGYRVEVRIVVWENNNVLTAPSSALFREAGQWSVYVVEGGRAQRQSVKVGRNNGVQAEILDGLRAGQSVVLYPAPSLRDRGRVSARVDE